jgi:single-strand DNA-binding protein
VRPANINRVVLTGNPTRDSELRCPHDGTAVCYLRAASTTWRKDGSTGHWGDKPNYLDVVVRGGQDEGPARQLTRGRGVAIDRLNWREYTAHDGSKRGNRDRRQRSAVPRRSRQGHWRRG